MNFKFFKILFHQPCYVGYTRVQMNTQFKPHWTRTVLGTEIALGTLGAAGMGWDIDAA